MKTSFSDQRDSERPPASFEEGFAVEPSPSPRPPQSAACCPMAKWALGGLAVLTLVGLAGLWTCLSYAENSSDTPKAAEAKRKELAKNLFFEVQGNVRRVILKGEVCLREGPQLEGLLCRKLTKEHEYILHVDVDARQVHAALIAAGARPGSPVKFEPRYTPATGTTIKITLQYQKDGKVVRVRAQDWIRDEKNKKTLQADWVFGGSVFIKDPDQPNEPPIYLANHGDMVCVCNMESAMLDLPVRSPKNFDDRVFKPFTERIPPLETPVDIILEPVLDKARDKEK